MEEGPSREANIHSGSQEIPLLLWNPKVNCRVHKSPPLVPTLSQMNPLNFPPYLPKIHSNITFPSTPTSSKCSFPFMFSDQNFVCISCFIYATCPTSHSRRFDHPYNTEQQSTNIYIYIYIPIIIIVIVVVIIQTFQILTYYSKFYPRGRG